MINRLYLEMIHYFKDDPRRIQHFTKVHSYAKLIGELEQLAEEEKFILEAAALVHDIGIKIAEQKYGSCEGKLQEKEGPAVAEEMLCRLDFPAETVGRICYLVGHHHSYERIEGLDYQILVEADFLVNFYEDDIRKEAVQQAYEKIFKTDSGRHICREMFGIGEK